MAIEKTDWEKLKREKEHRAQKRRTEHAPSERVVEILAGKLSDSPEWNHIKGYVASQMDKCEGLIESFNTIMVSPETTNHDKLMQAKIGYHAHKAALDAYTDVINHIEKFKKVDT